MAGYLDRDPHPRDPVRLFCFHHAGAGASTFAAWRGALGPGVAVYGVQLPGRENRVRDPRPTRFAALLSDLESRLAPYLTGDYAFYGHSMGAAVAAALAARSSPRALFVGAYPAPHLGPPLSVADLDDTALADLLVSIGGMSELVRHYPEWTKSATDLLRADLDLLHTHRPGPPVPMPVPITAYAGADDPLVPLDAVEEWSRHTRAGFTRRVVPGGHFFHQDTAVPADIARTLNARRTLAS